MIKKTALLLLIASASASASDFSVLSGVGVGSVSTANMTRPQAVVPEASFTQGFDDGDTAVEAKIGVRYSANNYLSFDAVIGAGSVYTGNGYVNITTDTSNRFYAGLLAGAGAVYYNDSADISTEIGAKIGYNLSNNIAIEFKASRADTCINNKLNYYSLANKTTTDQKQDADALMTSFNVVAKF